MEKSPGILVLDYRGRFMNIVTQNPNKRIKACAFAVDRLN
jgi:hypothetical protein